MRRKAAAHPGVFPLDPLPRIWTVRQFDEAYTAAGWVDARLLGTIIAMAGSVLGAWSLFRKFEGMSPGRKGSRWNQRTAAGWAICLLAATALEGDGLAGWRGQFKFAGILVGGVLLLLMPKALPKAAK